MRLVARQAVHRYRFLRFRIDGGADRVSLRRMSNAIFERQHWNIPEVVFRQPSLAVEDGDQMLVFHFVRLRVWTVTFEAERIDFFGSQQMLVLSAVRFMTRSAAFTKRGLVKMLFLTLLCLIRMAGEANFHAVGLRQSGLIAGVRIVAIGAIAHGTGMLHFCRFDLLHYFVMAGTANSLDVFLGQNNLPAFRRRVAHLAGLVGKRGVQKCLHQFRPVGFVRVVAGDTVGLFERLILVRFGQLRVLRIVTIQAQRWTRLLQMLCEFTVAARTGLMSFVARIAAHVQRHVATSFFWRVRSDGVAAQAEIFLLWACSRLQ